MKNSIHDIMILEGDGEFITNSNMKLYIDFTSGIFAAGLGMYNRNVAKAISEQASKCMHSYQFETPVRRRYLKKLCKFTGFETAYMFSSGTEATEAAYTIARNVTGKDGILGIPNGFHGRTMGAMIAAMRTADWRNQVPPEKAAAIILEPYNPLDVQFRGPTIIDKVMSLKKQYGMLVISDEIQAGFGRTGKLFGYQWSNLEPDLVCVGKAMANGFPASAVLGSSQLINHPANELSSTNGGNPLACAAGESVIDIFKQKRLIDRSLAVGNYMEEKLNGINCKFHGRGMVWALIFKDNLIADQVVLGCRDNRLLVVHTGMHTVKIAPPLTTSKRVIAQGIQTLKNVVREVS